MAQSLRLYGHHALTRTHTLKHPAKRAHLFAPQLVNAALVGDHGLGHGAKSSFQC